MRRAVASAIALVVLMAPAVAAANDFSDVYDYYKKNRTIKPCRFSDKQLRNAERQTPPDVEQYAPSFLDALAAARENGADCGKKAPAKAAAPPAAAPPTPSTPTPAPAPAATPTQTAAAAVPTATTPAPTLPAVAAGAPRLDTARAKRDTSTPAPIWWLAVVGAVALLAAIAAAAAWWFGWSPERWSRPLGASFSDFGSRFDDGRREFGDWLRLGH